LEDGWILARAIEHTTAKLQSASPRSNDDAQLLKIRILAEALNIFNEVRSPYYRRMHEHLDNEKARVLRARDTAKREKDDPKHIFEAALEARLGAFAFGNEMDWIYRNDIEVVWRNYLQRTERPTASNL